MPPNASRVLYVAPNGNDAWSGSRPAPNRAATDGPFQTLERARDEIRNLKFVVRPSGRPLPPQAQGIRAEARTTNAAEGGLPKGGVAVELRGGSYPLAKPFELAAEDSGTAEAPIVYRARPGDEARIVGGAALWTRKGPNPTDVTGWEKVTDKAILDRLDPAAREHVRQFDLKAFGITDYGSVKAGGAELFFQNQPMTLARWPNDGFIHIAGLVEPDTVNVRGTKGSKAGKFMYESDRPTRWAGEKDPWVHGYWFWDWADQRHPVESIDPEKKTIAVKPPYHDYGYRKGQWFYGLNLLCELDQPGEWYLDRQAGILYFWPPAPITPDNTILSVTKNLVTMRDASHVTLRGLTLEACRETAILVNGGTNTQIVGCTIRNVGSWAVKIAGGEANAVIGCDITATGDGGIALDGGSRKTLTPAGHLAENNHIHHYSRVNRMYQPAIALGGVGNRAVRNLIHDAPHEAIAFGGNDHLIEGNEIHSVCYESNDAGAIYAGRNWTMRGTVIRHNYLHDICGFEGRSSVGVYLDDMFCGTEIVGNVFLRVTMAAFIGGGRDCTVANNLFVDCPRALHIDSRALGWAKYHTEDWVKEGREKGTHFGIAFQKPPYSTRWPQLLHILDDEPFAPKGNVVERNVFVGERWNDVDGRAKPYVAMKDNLTDTDPLFVVPSPGGAGILPASPGLAGWKPAPPGDVPRQPSPPVPVTAFRLRPDSPAWKLGFQPIPLDQIGLYKDARRASWPVAHEVRPMPEPPAPKPKVRPGPPPVAKVPRAAAPITVDGTINPQEWAGADPGRALLIEQGIHGEKLAPPNRAWLAWDDAALYVAFDNAVDQRKPLRPGPTWGQDDAVEVALRNPAGGKDAPIFVLRGFPNGHFESSTEAGAPEAAAKKAGQAVQFAAKIVDAGRWTAEFRIPFAALGLDPARHPRLQCNLTVRRTAADLWLEWRGTGGYSWEVGSAGIIEFR